MWTKELDFLDLDQPTIIFPLPLFLLGKCKGSQAEKKKTFSLFWFCLLKEIFGVKKKVDFLDLNQWTIVFAPPFTT